MQAAWPFQDGLSKGLVAAHLESRMLEEELRIKKYHSTMLERWLHKLRSEVDATEDTDTAQFQLENVMPLRQVSSLSSQQSGLDSRSSEYEHVI